MMNLRLQLLVQGVVDFAATGVSGHVSRRIVGRDVSNGTAGATRRSAFRASTS